MTSLALLVSALLCIINGDQLVDEMVTTPSLSAVCIKMWSMTSNQWVFLGETQQLSPICSTKWYIRPEFSYCAHPGTCVSMRSAASGLYLSATGGELSSRLSSKEIWILSATSSVSGSRAILLENTFLESQYFGEAYLLCSDEDHKSLLFGDDDDGRNKVCHWMIEEAVDDDDEEEACSTEHRHRRAWHLLSAEERELYISAVQKLNENGKQWDLVAVHADFDANVQAHACSSFASYHRYHLWEFENAVRNLGGKYKCFTLPYWDITNEVLSSRNPFNWQILHSGLGHNGVEDDEWCINDDIFGKYGDYMPYKDCVVDQQLEPIDVDDDERPQCCLKRNVCDVTKRECTMYTASDIIEMIVEFDKAGTDEHQLIADPSLPPSQPLLRPSPPPTAGFMYELEYKHGNFHGIIGGGGHLSNLWFSPDEPIFWLMHTFVDYIFALWQDCHDYDLVKEEDIDSVEHGHDIYGGVLAEPDGKTQLNGPSRLDDHLILTELKNTDWAYVAINNLTLTPRDMHNISRWQYSYEKGTFWKNANVDRFCTNINKKWFYSEMNAINVD